MKKEPIILILRGNSGCGKTTTARLLQKKLGHGSFLISQDVVRREMLYVKDGVDTKALDLLIELINYGKKNCEIIILEGILNSNWYEKLFRHIKDLFDDNVLAYYFDVSFEETVKRHKSKPNAHEFGEEDMRRWWNQNDYIGFIDEIALNDEIEQDDIVNMIYKDIIDTNDQK